MNKGNEKHFHKKNGIIFLETTLKNTSKNDVKMVRSPRCLRLEADLKRNTKSD